MNTPLETISRPDYQYTPCTFFKKTSERFSCFFQRLQNKASILSNDLSKLDILERTSKNLPSSIALITDLLAYNFLIRQNSIIAKALSLPFLVNASNLTSKKNILPGLNDLSENKKFISNLIGNAVAANILRRVPLIGMISVISLKILWNFFGKKRVSACSQQSDSSRISESKQLPENRTIDQAHLREGYNSAAQPVSFDAGLDTRLGVTVDKEIAHPSQQNEDSPESFLASIVLNESLSPKEIATPQAPRASSKGIRKAKAPASFDVSPVHGFSVQRSSFTLSVPSFDPTNPHKELAEVVFGQEVAHVEEAPHGGEAAHVEEAPHGGEAAHVEEAPHGGEAAHVEEVVHFEEAPQGGEAASVEPFPPLVRQSTAEQRGNSHQGRRNNRNRKQFHPSPS
jgi:hypothetical protein